MRIPPESHRVGESTMCTSFTVNNNSTNLYMEPGPSFMNMAEAMLQNDDYKFSHTSLNRFGEDEKMNEAEVEAGNTSSNDLVTQQNRGAAAAPRGSSFSGSEKKSSEGRNVVIQVPPKRRKISTPFTPKEVVDALHSSVSREERLDAIFKCTSTFEHDDEEQHNLEIKAGADIALVKMLAFLEFKTGFRRPPIKANMGAITKEISLTCQALEMVYRASSDSVETSFNRVGLDLMQIIVILIDEEVKVRTQRFKTENSPATADAAPQPSKDEDVDFQLEENTRQRSVTPPPQAGWMPGDWDRDMMLCKAVKILGHYARVGRATRDIAHFPGLLGNTLNLINLRPFNSVPWEARLSCLWVIANLACSTENMMMMTCTPGLIHSLVNVGFRQVEPMEPLERTMEVLRARSLVARALSNLSWSPENKVILADNAALVTMLSQLAVKRKSPYSRSKTMQDVLTQTRQYAVGALRNLAAAPRRSKITLCEYGNGELLDTLADAALNDENESVVEKALAAVHNLAIHDNAEVMASKMDLVVALKNQLVCDGSEGESPSKAKAHASATLLVLERSIAPETPLYQNLRDLLDIVNANKRTEEEEISESGSEYPEGGVPV